VTDPYTPPPDTAPTESVADLEARLAQAREAEAAQAETERDISNEALDGRISELERRYNGGAVE
jgi:hypothetical protein